MSGIEIGTSGWSYPSGRGTWNGVFYPKRHGRGFDDLAYYAEHLSTVEVNSTFYRQPDRAAVASWVTRTPDTFSFAVKLFQKFTHPDMYVERYKVAEWDASTGDLDVFCDGIEPLATSGRLRAVLVQWPPSFRADPHTADYLAWLLERLRAYPLAVELRHHSWSDRRDETQHLLDEAGATWALVDEPKFGSSIAQDWTADAGISPLVYIRLHGRNQATWWQHAAAEDRYDYLYSVDELAVVKATVEKASQLGRKAMVYFNNHFSSKAVANAAILKHELGQDVPGIYRQEMVDRYPDLRGIVATAGLPL